MAQLGSTNVYGDLSVTGSETVPNLQVTKINGVTVGDSPKFTDTNTTYSAGTGLSLSGTTFSADGSAIINALGEGSSPAQRDDYIVAQYAGGGTTTTTYHRRKLSNVFAALSKSDVTTALGYTPPTSDTNTWRPIGTGATDAAAGNHTHSEYLTSHQSVSSSNNTATWSGTVVVGTVGSTDLKFTMPANPNTDTDTKNTAGSTNYSSKLFLIGAPTQAANPVTYSNSSVYASGGSLYASTFMTASSWTQSVDSSGNLVFTYG